VGCASGESEARPLVDQGQARLYGSDGNMRDGFGDALKGEPGVLAGMKGTTPLAPLTEDFKKRIRGIDPTVVRDFSYAGDTYDAVVVAALAAEAARTTEPTTMAKYIVGVTVGSTVCASFKECADAVHTGAKVPYGGLPSLKRSGFTDSGEPSTATYGTLNFGRDNHIDDAKTEFVGAGEDAAQAKTPPPPPGPPTKPGRVAA